MRHLDTFLLQAAALLICRGSVYEKVTLLADMVTSDKEMYCENDKLIRALKFMMYFAVIMPHKFMASKSQNELLGDILFHESQ